jgi:hypothetical protein
MKTRRNLALLLALTVEFSSFQSYGQTKGHDLDDYKGFHVDYAQVKDHPNVDLIKAGMNRQIDMVVEVGMADHVLALFRRIPVSVVPGKHEFAGHCLPKPRNSIEVSEGFFLRGGRKPVLIHEFLHGYHAQALPKGKNNPRILTFYRRAKELNAYDANSHMMRNAGEYFASAGTAYLFGVTALEPFTRERVQEKQPVFYKYLEGLFGPGAGNYKGSLNERIDVLKRATAEKSSSEPDE